MNSDSSNGSESSNFEDQLPKDDNGCINSANKNIQCNINQQNEQNQANNQIKEKEKDKNNDADQLEPEQLNFDAGDSEEKQFSKFFKTIKILGSGAFGKVVQAKELQSNKEYAVKIIAKNNVSQGEIDRLRKEAKILSSLDHKNIVTFKKVFESETRIFIVMELLLGGTLRQLMREKKKQKVWFTEQEVALIMNNIISGVAFFHSKSIVHRDIKPDNILIGDKNDLSTVKIADFGLSAAFEAKKSISFTQQCGTLIYMAPEFFIQKTYSKPIDIWSCAIIMYQLLCKGTHPFYDSKNDDNKSFKKKIKSSPQIKFPLTFSDITKSLIQKMTLLDPSVRYTANQVLLHPWITQKLEDDVPLTMNEMLLSVNKQTIFSNCRAFSLSKKKDTNQKIDIYSSNYLMSIMDLDLAKANNSFHFENQDENSKLKSDDKLQKIGQTKKIQTHVTLDNLNFMKDTSLQQQDMAKPSQIYSSSQQFPYKISKTLPQISYTLSQIEEDQPQVEQHNQNQVNPEQNQTYQNSSLTSPKTICQNQDSPKIKSPNLRQDQNQNQMNQTFTLVKNEQVVRKSHSPLTKRNNKRKQVIESIQKKQDSGNQSQIIGPGITISKQNSISINQLNPNVSNNSIQTQIVDKQPQKKTTSPKRKSMSLHKANTYQNLDQKPKEQFFQEVSQQTNQDSKSKLIKDIVVEHKSSKEYLFQKKMSLEYKDQDQNIQGINMKALNNQLSKKDKLISQNSVVIEQQRSISPRKKNTQIISIKRNNSRKFQDKNQGDKPIPVKVANSVSPCKNYNISKITRNPSIHEEQINLLPNLSQQNSSNTTLSNTIYTQRDYLKQSSQVIQSESPDLQRRASRLKSYNEMPDKSRLFNLQKTQITQKIQTNNPQNSPQQILQSQQTNTLQQSVYFTSNSNFKAVVDNLSRRTKNSSPSDLSSYSGQQSQIINSLNQQIQHFSKVSSQIVQQQLPKKSLPQIQNQLSQISQKSSNQASQLNQRQNRAISSDQKNISRRISVNKQNLNQSVLPQENNLQFTQNNTIVQNSINHNQINENQVKIHTVRENEMYTSNKRITSNISPNKITVNQRQVNKK